MLDTDGGDNGDEGNPLKLFERGDTSKRSTTTGLSTRFAIGLLVNCQGYQEHQGLFTNRPED